MLILSFESSAKACSTALVRDGQLLAECYQNTGMTHSQTLLKMAQDMLESCALTPAAVDAVACAAGPGSFTGVRIGLSAAKGFAWAGQLPCYGVSTLQAMAYGAVNERGIICAAMDARRAQVYNALFRSDGQALTRLTPDRAISAEALWQELEPLGETIYLVGDGASLCYDTWKEHQLLLAPEHLRQQRAAGVGVCAWEMARQGAPCDGATLTPNYLRLSQAERERLERLNSITNKET